jgi:hypothetical protein
MSSSTDGHITIQTTFQSIPSTPPWFGEVAVVAHVLRHLGGLRRLKSECASLVADLGITIWLTLS